MAEGNGQLTQAGREGVHILASALVDRLQVAARLGYSYDGARDIYAALGWKRRLTYEDYAGKYERQDIAGRIVDLPADDTWKDGFEIRDGGAPDNPTPFEQAWIDIEKRLRVTAMLNEADRLAGVGEYAVLYFGARNQVPETPLPVRSGGRPLDLIYLSAFPQPSAEFVDLDRSPQSERFGLPLAYKLQVEERTGTSLGGLVGTGNQINAHWSRVLHVCEPAGGSKLFGRPRLKRVYNLLDVLELVLGASGEAFWRGARPRFHADIDKDFGGQLSSADLAAVKDELEKWLHGFQDWVRTSGTEITQFGASVGDPRAPAEVAMDMVAAATGIPKRILLGSERGELASSQDAVAWAHVVDHRQKVHAEARVLRPLLDRWVMAGFMPEPTDGEYEIVWPDLTGPTAEQRVERIERMTNAEARHAQAKMLDSTLFTDNELREAAGYEPVEMIEQEYPGDETEADRERQEQADERAQEQMDRQAEMAPPANDDQEAPPAAASQFTANVRFADVVRAINAASDAILRAATESRVLAAIVDLGRRVVGRHAPGREFDPVTTAVRDYMARYTGQQVVGINETTRRELAATLFDGLRREEGNAQLQARVRRLFRDMSAGRAKVIALTEANSASAVGSLEGMVQAGVQFKGWGTMRDGSVREAHADMEGQIRPLGEPFTAPGGEETMRPGGFGVAALDVNCRCVVYAAEAPTNLQAMQDPELPRRRDVHERRVLAGVRKAFREQAEAVIAEL